MKQTPARTSNVRQIVPPFPHTFAQDQQLSSKIRD